jgi:hypothetical protein
MGTADYPIVILGLSGENVTRLMADEPVAVDLQDTHPELPPMMVVLFGGRNDEILLAKLKSEIPYFADAIPEVR